jgi:sugar phosphate isomerase/epimerase
MITRRHFLRSSIAAVTAAAISPDHFLPAEGSRLKHFGFISGIIDKELKGDWKTVLKQAAGFGYSEIETGGYLGDSARSFLDFCKGIGLRPVAGGLNFNAGDDEVNKGIALIKELEIDYAVVYWPWYTGGPFSLEDCKKSAERLNYLGKICRSNDLVFCWHNHNKEFTLMEKGMPFDYLMVNTDRDLVKCELDLYWVKKGGADPLSVMKKYPGRFAILHVKDMAPGPDMDFECPGSGIMDFRPLFREAENQGIKHFMVERDNVPDGMACLKSAAEYLSNVTF